jgi:hypothetical protein
MITTSSNEDHMNGILYLCVVVSVLACGIGSSLVPAVGVAPLLLTGVESGTF